MMTAAPSALSLLLRFLRASFIQGYRDTVIVQGSRCTEVVWRYWDTCIVREYNGCRGSVVVHGFRSSTGLRIQGNTVVQGYCRASRVVQEYTCTRVQG